MVLRRSRQGREALRVARQSADSQGALDVSLSAAVDAAAPSGVDSATKGEDAEAEQRAVQLMEQEDSAMSEPIDGGDAKEAVTDVADVITAAIKDEEEPTGDQADPEVAESAMKLDADTTEPAAIAPDAVRPSDAAESEAAKLDDAGAETAPPTTSDAQTQEQPTATDQPQSAAQQLAQQAREVHREHPWEHVNDILSILKSTNPLLALTIETMIDQILARLKPTSEEDMYRLLVALLTDGMQVS